MKQIEVVIKGKVSLDTEEIINEYFATEKTNDIEGFVFSEIEFYNSYRGTYPLEEMRTALWYGVYRVRRCDICWRSFDVIINDRAHLYRYLNSDIKFCHSCKGFHYGIMGELGAIQVEGEVAS